MNRRTAVQASLGIKQDPSSKITQRAGGVTKVVEYKALSPNSSTAPQCQKRKLKTKCSYDHNHHLNTNSCGSQVEKISKHD
jgi:hypothetical protein